MRQLPYAPGAKGSFTDAMGLRRRLFALLYDAQISGAEKAGLAAMRRRLLGEAAGRVLEVGAGTGMNLPHYGPGVESLTLTEPDPSMLRRLERAAAKSDRAASVLRAPAEDLPFDDGAFDSVVCTLVLCGVSDQPRAVREIRRVLTPGGRLLFLEHVRSGDDRLARRQDRLNWLNRAVVCCDCNRPTLRTIEQAGLVVEDIEETELPTAPSFARPLIVGTARRLAEGASRGPG
jgi:ubiquinone/menaquinone biosynthesis C-methylase UbiE